MEWYWFLAVAVALVALAIWSFRVFVESQPGQRWKKATILVVGGIFGMALVGELAGWDYWAPGLLFGLAMVELAPAAFSAVTGIFTQAGKMVGKIFTKDTKKAEEATEKSDADGQ